MLTSNHHNQSWRVIAHWLLVLALLLGQSVAAGHDHDVDQDHESACVLCLFAQQSDDIIPSMAGELSIQGSCVHVSRTFAQQTFAVTVPPFHSRAPPYIAC